MAYDLKHRPDPSEHSVCEASLPATAHDANLQLYFGKLGAKAATGSRLEVHDLIVDKRLTYDSLLHLLDANETIPEQAFADAVGVSTRTLRRARQTAKAAMPTDLASRTWMLAETLARAATVMGSGEAAQQWLMRPQMGLNGKQPIELLRTLQGAELVNDLLGRLEYGVYV